MIPDIFAETLGHHPRTPPHHPRKIGISLVNRTHFDQRGVIMEEGKHHLGEALVFVVISGKNNQVGTHLARPCCWHRGVNPQPPCLITSRSNDAPPHPPDRHRLAPQARLGSHLTTDKEGICVQMQRRSSLRFCFHLHGFTTKDHYCSNVQYKALGRIIFTRDRLGLETNFRPNRIKK